MHPLGPAGGRCCALPGACRPAPSFLGGPGVDNWEAPGARARAAGLMGQKRWVKRDRSVLWKEGVSSGRPHKGRDTRAGRDRWGGAPRQLGGECGGGRGSMVFRLTRPGWEPQLGACGPGVSDAWEGRERATVSPCPGTADHRLD